MPGARILVCESEAVVALDLQKSLHDMGYEAPVVASTAKEVVQAAFSMSPGLILTEVHLQGTRDGIEAVRLIRKRVDAPVIYLTADSDTATLERVSCTRPYAYLLKPFRLDQLRVSIELALYNHRLEAMAVDGSSSGTHLGKTTGRIDPHDNSPHIEAPSAVVPTVSRSERMLPICSCCKQIRDESGSWTQPEDYFTEHWNFLFTHSICPQCVNILRPQHR